jgi:hypothetical protein
VPAVSDRPAQAVWIQAEASIAPPKRRRADPWQFRATARNCHGESRRSAGVRAPASATFRSCRSSSLGREPACGFAQSRASGCRSPRDRDGDIGGVSTRPSEPGAPGVQSAYHRACGLYAIRTLRIAARPGVSAPGRGRVRDRELFGRSLLPSLVHAVRSGRWPWLGRLGGLSWRGPRRLRGNRRAVSAMLGQAS